MERRLTPGKLEVRTGENGQRTIVGYAAVFDSPSVPLPGWNGPFVERLAPGAFRNVLASDVRALWNHDPNFVLGRTAAGTLRLAEDTTGLRVEIDPPDSVLAQAFMASIERGDVSQMSFAFGVERDGQTWNRETTPHERTIHTVSALSDVSPVAYPAYPATTVAMRSYLGLEEEVPNDESDGQAPAEIEREDELRAQAEQRERMKMQLRVVEAHHGCD